MLGEKRSRAALQGDFYGSVQTGKSMAAGNPEAETAHAIPPCAGEDRPNQRDAGKQAEPTAEEIRNVPAGEGFPESGEDYDAPRRDVSTLRAHGLFFEADAEGRDFASVLKEVQAYLSKEYSSLVTAEGSEDARAQIRRFAGKYILDHRISVPGMDTETLIDAIYCEMAEFGFLTKYIYGEGIEEIDINAWDDVEVQFSGGVTEKLTYSIPEVYKRP